MLTDTEVMAKALARAIQGASTFGKAECEKALKVVSAMVKSGQCDDDTADRVRARLANQSAVRQHLEKHGLLDVQDDALSTAVKLENAKLDAELAEMTKPAKRP